jgi:hypothetical protein
MKTLGLLFVYLLGVLGMLRFDIEIGDDRAVLVSPPSAIVEGFTRQMVMRRYERALPYLCDRRVRRMRVEELAALGDRFLARTGKVYAVSGEQERIDGNRARGVAELETERAGRLELHYALVRIDGSWEIDSLPTRSGE